MRSDGTLRHKDYVTNQTDVVRWREYGTTQLVQREMRWSLQESGWMSNSKHVEHMMRLWRLKLESEETPTPVTKATGRRRDIDEPLTQQDVRASRKAAGTSSPAMGPSIQKETWAYRRQADPKTLHAQHSSIVEKHGRRACCDARPSRIRLTHRKSESALSDACPRWHRRGACGKHRQVVNSGGSG